MNENRPVALIADGEPSVRLSLCTVLSGLGFTVLEAARGEEAVALVRTVRFDVVLLDINMPGPGGIEVCRMMRKNAPILPIVMLTVQGSGDRRVEALDAGADDYLTRPFQLRELIAHIQAAAGRSCGSADEIAQILIGDVRLDIARHLVQKRGKKVHLTPK